MSLVVKYNNCHHLTPPTIVGEPRTNSACELFQTLFSATTKKNGKKRSGLRDYIYKPLATGHYPLHGHSIRVEHGIIKTKFVKIFQLKKAKKSRNHHLGSNPGCLVCKARVLPPD